ncbi:MAG: DegT/DnrJ/EryC1/StrS family aminotransferase [Candidatus Lokiarchaeia archaeon]
MKSIQPFKKPIYIIRPLLPPLREVYKKIKEIWKSKWLTNMGIQHQILEHELMEYLDVPNLTLFCNGTLALQLAYQALELKGEVITTPFTFPATINSLIQNNLKPIYCDIRLDNFNIDCDLIENLITPNTTAILPVHVFGNPCEIEKIEKVAKKYNLKIIYDAAHCFGITYKNRGIGNFGDVSMFSFHATKIFHTIEGGALTYNDPDLKESFNLLKNFGIKNEEEVILPGINAKMNELQAMIGLLTLHLVEDEIEKRKTLTAIYKENLKKIEGIQFLNENQNVKYNYQYFPILIDEKGYGLSRNLVYEKLKDYNVFSRKYFYPLCCDYQFNKSVSLMDLPIAKKIVNEILCLPLYGELREKEIVKICDILYYLQIKSNQN